MSQDIALAQEYKRRVVEAFHERVAKVVLFGSRARGDSRPDSDLGHRGVSSGRADSR